MRHSDALLCTLTAGLLVAAGCTFSLFGGKPQDDQRPPPPLTESVWSDPGIRAAVSDILSSGLVVWLIVRDRKKRIAAGEYVNGKHK